MNAKDRLIMEEYRESKSDFEKLEEITARVLKKIVDDCQIVPAGIEHRVKEEKSLEGKLYRNGDSYQSLDDLTDILGARVICFFSDEVDIVGRKVEEFFQIDWENSSDKRKLIAANSFGYLSVHYIVSLPENAGYPEELCARRFEIQICTILQHAWAAIDHDIAYKSKFGVPRQIVRSFSRLAGLLEIADDEFVRTRDAMNRYTNETHQQIIDNEADDLLIDMVSLNEYVNYNKKMAEFLEKLAAVCHAEIMPVNPESYLEQLAWLGKRTLGDLQQMLEENRELAVKLVEASIAGSELDIISSNIGLRYLCRAELLQKGYTEKQITGFMRITANNHGRAERQAKRLLRTYEKIRGEEEE